MSSAAIAYIDGHNFYHGAMKDSPPLKWLDFIGLCGELLGRHGEIQTVKYYTAQVVDLGDPSQSQRQNIYIQAIKATGVEVIEGRFARREKLVRLKKGGKLAQAIVYEEKGTDVNLAADLVEDSCSGLQVALVISNDSDLQRAVDIALRRGVKVLVANPHHRSRRKPDGTRNRRYRPALTGSEALRIRRAHLLRHQLPDIVDTPSGPKSRPTEWS